MRTLKYIGLILLLGVVSCHTSDESVLKYYDSSGPYQTNANSAVGDSYIGYGENPFIAVTENKVSTFSIDADGASYANIRRFIQQDKVLPPIGAVRTEELINYFQLNYEFSGGQHPIELNGEISHCPWNEGHKLLRIGVQGRPIPLEILPASNFVFLIDVSGSMNGVDRLDLLKAGFNNFVDQISEEDRIAIVTYAGNAGIVLHSTSGKEKQKIKDAINKLGAGGGTAGAEGIKTAYEIAEQNMILGGNNRIIIGTDGDFNIGPSSHDELIDLIEEKRETGIYLTVLGVGRGNLRDGTLEQIANNGNGNYEYIDNLRQLEKIFIYEYEKFYTVAKDVKIQVNFNEYAVDSFRLIGYENRLLADEDFVDDKKDAGEIGVNQNITALYEFVPTNNVALQSGLVSTIDLRYKNPGSEESIPMSIPISDIGNSFELSSDHMKFVSSVASFGMLLSDSSYKGTSSFESILDWLNTTNLNDEYGFKSEFYELVLDAQGL